MRTTIALLLGTSTSIASAQLVNGSFEDGLDGWQVIIYAGQGSVSLSTEVPPGGGMQSLLMPISSTQLAGEHQVIQPLGTLTPGTVAQYGGWMKALVAGAVFETEPSITLCTCDSAGNATPAGPELSYIGPQYSWSFHQTTMTILGAPPFGHYHCLNIGSGLVYQNLGFEVWFDEVFFAVDPSTSADSLELHAGPTFRPNPAADKLWIDLPAAPLSITAIDASGRTHDLKNFTHRDRTLEVDVNALPPGICLLRITTASGTHAVRFVKA